MITLYKMNKKILVSALVKPLCLFLEINTDTALAPWDFHLWREPALIWGDAVMSDACQGPVLMDWGINAEMNLVTAPWRSKSLCLSVCFTSLWPGRHGEGSAAPRTAAQSCFQGATGLWANLSVAWPLLAALLPAHPISLCPSAGPQV